MQTWLVRQHPYMLRESGHISYKHIKSNIVDELTITSQNGGQDHFSTLNSLLVLRCFMQQHLNTFHTFFPLSVIHLYNASSQNVLK